MKQFLKKHGKGILSAVGVTAATIVAYYLAHDAATFERGYEAIGGEIFVCVLPFAIAAVPIITEPFRKGDNNDLD